MKKETVKEEGKDNPDFFRSASGFQKWISLGGQNDNSEEMEQSFFFSPPFSPATPVLVHEELFPS